MIKAKEIDGELWIKESDHHQAIKEALAQPEQEPDWKDEVMEQQEETILWQANRIAELIDTQPPQRTWVGLTEQQRNDIEDACEMIIGKPAFDATEAKLKELNT